MHAPSYRAMRPHHSPRTMHYPTISTHHPPQLLTHYTRHRNHQRLPPPMLEVSDAELMWLNPDYSPHLLWETGLCQDNSKGRRVEFWVGGCVAAGRLVSACSLCLRAPFAHHTLTVPNPHQVLRCVSSCRRLSKALSSPRSSSRCWLSLRPTRGLCTIAG